VIAKSNLETQKKGDLAVLKVASDLTQKGFVVLKPIVSESCRYDLVVDIGTKLLKIQVKFMNKGGVIPFRTISNNTKGYKLKKYLPTDFDYYAIYFENKNIVIYPNQLFGGKIIRTEYPKTSATKFYWYEDFLNFTDETEKRKLPNKEKIKKDKKIINKKTIVKRIYIKKFLLSKEELEKLIWEIPTVKIAKLYNVSDKCIEKYCKKFGIQKPPRGYWQKINSSLCLNNEK
jgi:hypothetical protein